MTVERKLKLTPVSANTNIGNGDPQFLSQTTSTLSRFPLIRPHYQPTPFLLDSYSITIRSSKPSPVSSRKPTQETLETDSPQHAAACTPSNEGYLTTKGRKRVGWAHRNREGNLKMGRKCFLYIRMYEYFVYSIYYSFSSLTFELS
ncbi:hypothetical protein GYMLUDRAFT_253659 [Collybiopsis luxurians FD-317 M1]|uniref:Uncharacterized protein n=1 Tax=Collybiopsis luxurians FD-317 M1 TaxID=944289 RepID=A0A0D0BVX9_9AGAR|nr:hypothetical protein GYMLUDRAFT_253659 [Collybiopsis luxurians FD-317 M1]